MKIFKSAFPNLSNCLVNGLSLLATGLATKVNNVKAPANANNAITSFDGDSIISACAKRTRPNNAKPTNANLSPIAANLAAFIAFAKRNFTPAPILVADVSTAVANVIKPNAVVLAPAATVFAANEAVDNCVAKPKPNEASLRTTNALAYVAILSAFSNSICKKVPSLSIISII